MARLGGVTANTTLVALSCFLKLLADLREGFVRQRTDPGRWVVQGVPRNAQIQSLGKVDVDVDRGWDLGHRSCDNFCCSQTSSAVSKATKISTLQFPTSPLTSRALFLHVNDCLSSLEFFLNTFSLQGAYTHEMSEQAVISHRPR